MRRLRARLPPVNSLIAFEASARHLSFTRAGGELGVSREAVSRQIRILERHLGIELFIRRHRALELSKAGLTFQVAVHEGLEEIARSAQALTRGRSGKVTVTATVAIASYWLTPRLPRFRRRYPETEIRVVVSDAAVDMRAGEIDIGMRYGDGDWPDLESVHLFDIESFPVCSPAYLESAPVIVEPRDLLGHTLLNLDGVLHALEDWTWWLEEIGASPGSPSPLDILGFDHYANVIQAALDGQGIALGFSHIVDDLLTSGRLVRPLQAALNPGHAVYLVAPTGFLMSATATQFFDWVIAEAKRGPPAG